MTDLVVRLDRPFYFPRGPGPLVSVLLPTRGRPGPLVEAVQSLREKSTTGSVEFLFKCDDDDPETVKACEGMLAVGLAGGIMVSPRGNGYADMHHWVNDLSRDAQGDWLIIWNDDARMLTLGWDEMLLNVGFPPRYWHGVTDVCCLAILVEDDPGSSAFFFLRRKVTEVLGRFSYIPHNDTWATTLMRSVNSLFPCHHIVVRHMTDLDDDVRKEARPALDTLEFTVMSRDGQMTKLRDAIKLQEYIDANRRFEE